jgi:hypothetical protein
MGRFGGDAVHLPGADGLEVMLPGEQPAIGVHYTLFAPDLPPFAQQHEQVLREHGIAMPSAFAALDPEQHALAIDIADLEVGNLRGAETSPVRD